MKRGVPHGHGSSRPMQIPQNLRSSPGEPLMTGHLQGLQDIDMELELLKRKREIIEQQQHILSNTYIERNDFEQPQFSQSCSTHYDDYTSLYDNPHESQGYGRGAPNRKRAQVPMWGNEFPAKRFSGPSRGIRKGFGARLGPPPNNPRPDFQRPGPRPFNPRPNIPPPAQKKKEFNPTKVTKPSTVAPPAKLASYQPAERKKLVAATLASSGATVHDASKNSDIWILRADREPSRQMVGRLELALGAIMKDLKSANPTSEELFRLPSSARAMKQAVRDRIRTAMMGKVVSTSDNIQAVYYDMFPHTEDDHVVMKGLEAYKGSQFIPIKADDAQTYFKKNIHRLMSVKLEEMTNQLEQIYTGNNPGNTQKKRNRHHQGQPKTPYNSNAAESNVDDEQPKADNDQPETVADESKMEKPQTNLDNGQPQTDESKSQPGEAQSITEKVPEPIEVQVKPDETQIKTASQATPVEMASNKDSDNEAFKNLEPPPELINTELYKEFDKLMTKKIIHLLKKFSPTVLNIMDLDQMYCKTKAMILNETRKKLVGNAEDVQPSPQNTDTTDAVVTPGKRFLQPLLYHAKILGKPSLPKRKAMEIFFDKFNPQSVKKHKTIHNLLFVSFLEKENYDKLLAAHGTVIGRFTLDIRVSERILDRKNPFSANNDSSVESETSITNMDEPELVLGADLDEQITDLLSSIRKAEQDSSSDDVTVEPPADYKNDVKKENEDQIVKMETDVAVEITEPQKEVKDEFMNNKSIKKETPDKAEKTSEVKNNVTDFPALIAQPDVVKDQVAENVEAEKKEPDVIEDQGAENVEAEKKDVPTDLKTGVKDVKATPTRASARLATPGGIRTRRMSKLE